MHVSDLRCLEAGCGRRQEPVPRQKGRENGLFNEIDTQMIGDALREHLVIRHMMPAV